MNNAKMTFRFDHPKGKPDKRRETAQESKVIPLNVEEYHVHEERAERVEYAENKSSVPANRDFIDAQTLNQYTSDFGGWQSSFDAETQRIEQMIRKSGAPSPESPHIRTAVSILWGMSRRVITGGTSRRSRHLIQDVPAALG